MFFFVENLTLRTWLLRVGPRLFSLPSSKRRTLRCFTIDRSRLGWAAARLTAAVFGFSIEILDFRLLDIRDPDGTLLRYRLSCEDAFILQKDIMSDARVVSFLADAGLSGRFPAFLAKTFAPIAITQPDSLGRAVFLVHAALWKMRNLNAAGSPARFFIERRPWIDRVQAYAAPRGIDVIPVPASVRWKTIWQDYAARFPERFRVLLSLLRHRRNELKNGAYRRAALRSLSAMRTPTPGNGPARMGVEFYGHLNVDQPDQHSDLFFWQDSSIPGDRITVCFGLGYAPLTPAMLDTLRPHGLRAIATRPEATTTSSVPVYNLDAGSPARARPSSTPEARDLRRKEETYRRLRANWGHVFRAERIKLFVSWFKYDATHCAIADALKDAGGALALYQRAFDTAASPEIAIHSDIVFGFSQDSVEIERAAGSSIPYYVVTGYLGDRRIGLLKEPARKIRARLQEKGARRILAYFDENSANDPRWHTGHGLQREGYEFFLRRVLSEPFLGLVIKPKVPKTLRRRLGPVADLLKQAEATGRCLVLEGGELSGAHPPVLAALAADVAVHSCLGAATAGLEAALSGVPTVLVDREGWPSNRLYDLGRDRVAFSHWEDVWRVLQEHWTRPGGVPGFGDWGEYLRRFDPFRDGRAAERMAFYIQGLLQEFDTGLDCDRALANAAERYAKIWGSNTILSVNQPARVDSLASRPV